MFTALAAAPGQKPSRLYIEDQNPTPVGDRITVPVKISSVTDLYAYEIHIKITPLGNAPDVVTLDTVADVLLARDNSGFRQVLPDGVAATRVGVPAGVSGSNETVCNITLNFPAAAVGGRYKVSIENSQLSTSELAPISHTRQAGVVGPAERGR